jgi:hypothetical protein
MGDDRQGWERTRNSQTKDRWSRQGDDDGADLRPAGKNESRQREIEKEHRRGPKIKTEYDTINAQITASRTLVSGLVKIIKETPQKALAELGYSASTLTPISLLELASTMDGLILFRKSSSGSKLDYYLPIQKKLFELCLESGEELGSREASNLLRMHSNYMDALREFGPADISTKNLEIQHGMNILGKLALLWSQQLSSKEPNAIDYSFAMQGLAADRMNLEYTKSDDLSRISSQVAQTLKTTSEKFSDCLSKHQQLTQEDINSIDNLLDALMQSVFVSKKLTEILGSVFFSKDTSGRTALDRFEDTEYINSDQSSLYRLSSKCRILGGLSAQSYRNLDALKDLEDELRAEVKGGHTELISLETIAGFTEACVAHNHTPDTDLLNTLETRLCESKDAFKNKNLKTNRVARNAILALFNLKDELQPETRKLVSDIVNSSNHLQSYLEQRVGEVLKQFADLAGLEIETNLHYGLSELDILLTGRFNGQEVKLNVEVDGFPYHSVFMIDEGSFSDTEHPFKQMMRDRYLEKKGFTILRLRSNDIAPDRVVNGREVIKLVEEALPKA